MLSTPSPPSADRVPAQCTGDDDLGVLVGSAAASPIRPEHASELVDCQIASASLALPPCNLGWFQAIAAEVSVC
jgi:hypothetical protein